MFWRLTDDSTGDPCEDGCRPAREGSVWVCPDCGTTWAHALHVVPSADPPELSPPAGGDP
jgi:rubrerythrin